MYDTSISQERKMSPVNQNEESSLQKMLRSFPDSQNISIIQKLKDKKYRLRSLSLSTPQDTLKKTLSGIDELNKKINEGKGNLEEQKNISTTLKEIKKGERSPDVTIKRNNSIQLLAILAILQFILLSFLIVLILQSFSLLKNAPSKTDLYLGIICLVTTLSILSFEIKQFNQIKKYYSESEKELARGKTRANFLKYDKKYTYHETSVFYGKLDLAKNMITIERNNLERQMRELERKKKQIQTINESLSAIMKQDEFEYD